MDLHLFHLVSKCYDSRDAVSWVVTYTWAGEVAACAPLPTRWFTLSASTSYTTTEWPYHRSNIREKYRGGDL